MSVIGRVTAIKLTRVIKCDAAGLCLRVNDVSDRHGERFRLYRRFRRRRLVDLQDLCLV